MKTSLAGVGAAAGLCAVPAVAQQPKKKAETKEKTEDNLPVPDDNRAFELLERFSQPEHRDITELMAEPEPEETPPLEQVASQFVQTDEGEDVAGSKYTTTEGEGEYKKYKRREEVNPAEYPETGKQLKQYKAEMPGFSPTPPPAEAEAHDFGYKTKKKKQEQTY